MVQSGLQVACRTSPTKNAYVLASHSHFYMEDIYNTQFWHHNGGVLPGWIVGTAGAVRYLLPLNKDDAKTSATDVYGYLLGTVHGDGAIDFQFRLADTEHILDQVKSGCTENFIWDTCFSGNRSPDRQPLPVTCAPVAQPLGARNQTVPR